MAEAREREVALGATRLAEMAAWEAELRQEVAEPQAMPLGAADQVVKLIGGAEERGNRRDRLYFGLGVLATMSVGLGTVLLDRLLS